MCEKNEVGSNFFNVVYCRSKGYLITSVGNLSKRLQGNTYTTYVLSFYIKSIFQTNKDYIPYYQSAPNEIL